MFPHLFVIAARVLATHALHELQACACMTVEMYMCTIDVS